jgi:hypothetical protein
MTDDLETELKRLLRRYGARPLHDKLDELAAEGSKPGTATILVNEGIHYFPETLFQGDRFVVYKGSLDLSNEGSLRAEVTHALSPLATFLMSKKWRKIYLVISGHAVVCMQVKLLVYRITHLETVDLVFDGAGNYLQLALSMRELIEQARANRPN